MTSPQTTVATCPSPDDLAAFIQGNLPVGDLETIAGHVNSCATCESVVEQANRSVDALMVSLRNLAGSDLNAASHLDPQIEAVKSYSFAGRRTPRADVHYPIRLREYELLEPLGEGGMGAVYRALHTRLDKIVAVKMLAAGRLHKPEAVARFQREMRAVGKLRHPNIVQATDAGEVDGTYYLVMELVEGADLSKLVKRLGPMSVREACELTRQAALGLEYAHRHDLVHRDVKPSNLLLSQDGQIKLLDLGLARLGDTLAADEYSTASSVVMGSFDYMAPEQADNPHSVDVRADLYSLGCTLYYLLAGEPLFPSTQYATPMQKLKAHAAVPPPKIQDRRSDIPADLVRLLDRLLAKDPKDRCATAAEVAAALEVFSRGCDLTPLLGTGGGVRDVYDTAPPTSNTLMVVRKAESSGGHRRRRNFYLAGGMAFGLLALLGVMIVYIRTDTGMVEIVSDDRDVKVVIEQGGDQVKLIDLLTNQQIELRSGKYHLRVDGREDLELVASDFDLMRGKKVVARIRRKAMVENRPGPEISERLNRPSPADALQRETIPAKMLAAAGGGDPQEAPANLVGMMGQQVFWCGAMGSSVCFSPDGKRLAATTKDPRNSGLPGAVRVFSVGSGETQLTLGGHESGVNCVRFSPDGERLATCSLKMVKIWNAHTGEALRTFNEFKYYVNTVAFNHDGRRLVTGGGELRTGTEMKIWDLESGKQLLSFDGHRDTIAAVALSPDGKRLASASYDLTVKLWDIESGKDLLTLGGHGHWVHGVAFSPDGNRLASASYDYNVRLWNLATGKLEHTLSHPWVAPDATFSSDGKYLATACWDQKVRLFDAQSAKPLTTFDGHFAIVNRVAFSSDSKQLAIVGEGNNVQLWDVEDGGWHFSQAHRSEVTTVAVSPAGNIVASGSNDHTLRLWDLATSREVRTLIDEDYSHGGVSPLRSLVYDSQGQMLVSSHENGRIKVWDPHSGALRYKLTGSNKPGGIPCALSGDGTLLATGDVDGLVKLWNPQNGTHLRTLRGHTSPVRALTLSLNGQTLASGSEDGVIRLWDPVTGAELRAMTQEKLPVRSLAFVADDRLLAVGWDSEVKLFDVATGNEQHILTGHRGSIRMAYHASRRTLAACGAEDRSVRLWDLSHDPPQLQNLPVIPGDLRIESLAFTPEGRYLVTGNSNGTLYVLRLSPVPTPNSASKK